MRSSQISLMQTQTGFMNKWLLHYITAYSRILFSLNMCLIFFYSRLFCLMLSNTQHIRSVHSSHRHCRLTLSWTQTETYGSTLNYAWLNLPSFWGNEHRVLFWYKVTSLAVITFDAHQEDFTLQTWELLILFPFHRCFSFDKGRIDSTF